MAGPCLCGDPCCGRCFPGGAAADAAIDRAVEELGKAGLRPEEVDMAIKIGILAVIEARHIATIRAQEARDEERLFLEEAGRRPQDVHKPG